MAKQVIDRQGATETVASAAETHAGRIADAFASAFADCLEGKEKMPDVALLVTLLARKQRQVNVALVTASDAYDKELADDTAPREARDEAAAALTAEVVDIRGVVESTYGAGMLRSLGIDGKTDVEPKAILSKSKKLASALTDPERKWPKPARKGVKVDPGEWAGDLETWSDKLEQSLKDVMRETREAQAALDVKDRAQAANDVSFMRIARFLSAAFYLVGDDVLATKVRPSARRPGTVLDENEGEDEGEDAVGGAAPAADKGAKKDG